MICELTYINGFVLSLMCTSGINLSAVSINMCTNDIDLSICVQVPLICKLCVQVALICQLFVQVALFCQLMCVQVAMMCD